VCPLPDITAKNECNCSLPTFKMLPAGSDIQKSWMDDTNSEQCPKSGLLRCRHLWIKLSENCKNFWFVNPCIFIHSNKLIPTRCRNLLQVYCLSLKYSSTCFGHPLAHHQEPIYCSSSLLFTYERGGSSAVGRGRSGWPTALLPPRSYGKPEAAAAAVDRLLMMGKRMSETCWAVFKRQAINLQLIAASSWY
jgi:hypothetical protein